MRTCNQLIMCRTVINLSLSYQARSYESIQCKYLENMNKWVYSNPLWIKSRTNIVSQENSGVKLPYLERESPQFSCPTERERERKSELQNHKLASPTTKGSEQHLFNNAWECFNNTTNKNRTFKILEGRIDYKEQDTN